MSIQLQLDGVSFSPECYFIVIELNLAAVECQAQRTLLLQLDVLSADGTTLNSLLAVPMSCDRVCNEGMDSAAHGMGLPAMTKVMDSRPCLESERLYRVTPCTRK